MDDRFYVPGWMRREAEKRVAAEHQNSEEYGQHVVLHLARAQHEAEQARDALLWKQEEEKRLLEEQKKEEKRFLAEREEFYRKRLANRSNDYLRKLLHRKAAKTKAKYWKLSPKTVRTNAKLRKLLLRSTNRGSLLPVSIPPNEYHRERRVFAPPINRLSRDSQHRAWNGYEWELV